MHHVRHRAGGPVTMVTPPVRRRASVFTALRLTTSSDRGRQIRLHLHGHGLSIRLSGSRKNVVLTSLGSQNQRHRQVKVDILATTGPQLFPAVQVRPTTTHAKSNPFGLARPSLGGTVDPLSARSCGNVRRCAMSPAPRTRSASSARTLESGSQYKSSYYRRRRLPSSRQPDR